MARMNYDVTVSGADNGIIVGIGCKKLVFNDSGVEDFLADLRTYISGSRKSKIELHKRYFPEDFDDKHATLGGGCVQVPCEQPYTGETQAINRTPSY